MRYNNYSRLLEDRLLRLHVTFSQLDASLHTFHANVKCLKVFLLPSSSKRLKVKGRVIAFRYLYCLGMHFYFTLKFSSFFTLTEVIIHIVL